MTLSAGTRLGPYELVAPVGAGGMGEVYRAKDTRLDRTGAVKVLPPHPSSSAESRQRALDYDVASDGAEVTLSPGTRLGPYERGALNWTASPGKR